MITTFLGSNWLSFVIITAYPQEMMHLSLCINQLPLSYLEIRLPREADVSDDWL